MGSPLLTRYSTSGRGIGHPFRAGGYGRCSHADAWSSSSRRPATYRRARMNSPSRNARKRHYSRMFIWSRPRSPPTRPSHRSTSSREESFDVRRGPVDAMRLPRSCGSIPSARPSGSSYGSATERPTTTSCDSHPPCRHLRDPAAGARRTGGLRSTTGPRRSTIPRKWS